MYAGLSMGIKEYVWASLKKITNSHTNLTVNNLFNGYVKCIWEISAIDNFRLKLSKSCFYAIRLFDISNNRNKHNSTCIMKEIQVSQFQSSISFPIPINKGVYYFEFGYRKKNGEWRMLASQNLNLGYRIKKIIKKFDNDNWFDSNNIKINNNLMPHETAYQLSFNKFIGGSEEVFNDRNDM